MSKLLITGSRCISEAGLAFARRAVQRARQLDYEVIVGDASGVDEAVMQECDKLGVTCTVVGAYDRLRRRTPSCKVIRRQGSYIQRDRYMAEQCSMCLAIWNGESRGTKATYDFVVELGKTAWLKTFHSEDSRGERPAREEGSAMNVKEDCTMKIVSAYWTAQVNMLRVRCSCGHTFNHRSDRWKVRCPRCKRHANLGNLRDYYLKEGFAMDWVNIWTDGACSGNPGPGGWAAILRWNGHEREVTGHELETTNNRMELTAVIEGLAALKKPCSVTVTTDSQYVIGIMTLNWKRKANHDLVERLDALCAEHDVTFAHVRGHAGHPMNERADELACMERDRARWRADRKERIGHQYYDIAMREGDIETLQDYWAGV